MELVLAGSLLRLRGQALEVLEDLACTPIASNTSDIHLGGYERSEVSRPALGTAARRAPGRPRMCMNIIRTSHDSLASQPA